MNWWRIKHMQGIIMWKEGRMNSSSRENLGQLHRTWLSCDWKYFSSRERGARLHPRPRPPAVWLCLWAQEVTLFPSPKVQRTQNWLPQDVIFISIFFSFQNPLKWHILSIVAIPHCWFQHGHYPTFIYLEKSIKCSMSKTLEKGEDSLNQRLLALIFPVLSLLLPCPSPALCCLVVLLVPSCSAFSLEPGGIKGRGGWLGRGVVGCLYECVWSFLYGRDEFLKHISTHYLGMSHLLYFLVWVELWK